MLKSPDTYLQDLYLSYHSDMSRLVPDIRDEIKRDSKRLLSAIETRGVHFVLSTLPEFGKHFDVCLSQGRLTLSGLAHMGPSAKGSPIPRLYKGLLLRVFDSSGLLRVDPDRQAIRLLRQAYRLAKKYKIACSNSNTWRSVHEFYQVDQECRTGSLDWDSVDTSLGDYNSLHLLDYCRLELLEPDFLRLETALSSDIEPGLVSAIQDVADITVSSIGRFNPLDWRAKHGPGAVSDLKKGETKYVFPHWPDKLDRVFPFAEFGVSSYSTWVDTIDPSEGLSWKHEPPSRLIAVPKTYDKPRLIASEPVAHQWCQQIILDFLKERIRSTFINDSVRLRDQNHNASMALLASQTLSHSTIDLSSASDRLSCYLVERIFRRNPSLLEAFKAVRTRWISNDIDRNSPRFHKLRKFATMGSALTFPIQSLVFYCISMGCLAYSRREKPSISWLTKNSKEVRVFGDDIIVPIDASGNTLVALQAFGLKINRSKTFVTGKFRESCGCDAYDGVDVTPCNVVAQPEKVRPESVTSTVDVHNNLLNAGYENTAAYLQTRLRGMSIPFRRPDSGAFGLVTFDDSRFSSVRTRWNSRLHQREVYVLCPIARTRRTPTRGDLMLLQYYTEASKVRFVEDNRLGLASRASFYLKRCWVQCEGYL